MLVAFNVSDQASNAMTARASLLRRSHESSQWRRYRNGMIRLQATGHVVADRRGNGIADVVCGRFRIQAERHVAALCRLSPS